MRKLLLLAFCLYFSTIALAQTDANEIALERIEAARTNSEVILDLSNLGLSEVPTEIATLSEVRFLLLGFNQFSSFPLVVIEMTNLEMLDLARNQLTSVPPEIGNMSNLQQLHLSSNQLKTLPAEIGNLSSLISLSLDYNQLTSLPTEFTQLSKLQALYLNNNQVSELPDDFGNMDTLCNLDLSGNRFQSQPAAIDELERLDDEGCNVRMMGNPFVTATAIAATNAFEPMQIIASVTPLPFASPTYTPAPLPMPIEQNPNIESADFEKLILGAGAIFGILTALLLGLRLQSKGVKKKR